MAVSREERAPSGLIAYIDAAFTFIGEITLLFWDVVKRLWRPPVEVAETVNQMAFIGAASVPIVALTGFFSGAVLALYLSEFLNRYGVTQFAGATVGLSVTRELAPVITGIMVAARCGSAMSAQIGTMKVTEQIDALKMLSVNPTNYLIIPRIVACVTMLPILALVSMYAGIGGGMVVSSMAGISSASFLNSMKEFLHVSDFLGGLGKMPFFGVIIAMVACQQGLRTSGGAVGVGKSTTNTVVISMVLIYISNYFLAQVFFGASAR